MTTHDREDPEDEEVGKAKHRATHKDASEQGKNARQGGGPTNGE